MKLYFLLILILAMSGSCKQKEPVVVQKESYTTEETIVIKKKVLQLLTQEEARLAKQIKQSPHDAEAKKLYAFVLTRQQDIRRELGELEQTTSN